MVFIFYQMDATKGPVDGKQIPNCAQNSTGGVGDGESGWAMLKKKTLLAYNNKSNIGKLYVLCIISLLILLIF